VRPIKRRKEIKEKKEESCVGGGASKTNKERLVHELELHKKTKQAFK
jgi:hypothetical protein